MATATVTDRPLSFSFRLAENVRLVGAIGINLQFACANGPKLCLRKMALAIVGAPSILFSHIAPAQELQLKPFVEVSERHTDNVLAVENSRARDDWVTDIATGFKLKHKSIRSDMEIDYRLDRFLHSRLKSIDRTENRLMSRATFEAIEDWLFVNATASITQENRNIFGIASAQDFPSNPTNRVETSNYRIAPYVRGGIANFSEYKVQLNAIETRVSDATFPTTRTIEWTGFARNANAGNWMGWSLDGDALRVHNVEIGNQVNARGRASLIAAVTQQVHVSAGIGVERTNLDEATISTKQTHNFGFEWSPNQRSKFAAVTQKRFFGYDHLVAFGYRTRLTAWRFSSNKEVMVMGNRLLGEQSGTVQGLLFDLLAATIADPAGRAEAAQRKFELTGAGSPSGITRDSLVSQPYLSRRQEASVVFLGPRNTVTLNAGLQEQRAFSGNSNMPVRGRLFIDSRQTGVNVVWAYRLSPQSTLNLNLSHASTRSLSGVAQSSSQQQQSLFLVTRLGPRTSTSVGLRRTSFDSTQAAAISENSIACSIRIGY